MKTRTLAPQNNHFAQLGASFSASAAEIDRIRDELCAIRDRVQEAAARFGANVGATQQRRN